MKRALKEQQAVALLLLQIPSEGLEQPTRWAALHSSSQCLAKSRGWWSCPSRDMSSCFSWGRAAAMSVCRDGALGFVQPQGTPKHCIRYNCWESKAPGATGRWSSRQWHGCASPCSFSSYLPSGGSAKPRCESLSRDAVSLFHTSVNQQPSCLHSPCQQTDLFPSF